MQLRGESLLEKRLNLLQQNLQNCQNLYVVSYLTTTFKEHLCLVIEGVWFCFKGELCNWLLH